MMMPVARLALLRAYPRSELLPVLNFVTMPGLVGPILGPVLGGVFVTWPAGIDFPDKHSDRRNWHSVRP